MIGPGPKTAGILGCGPSGLVAAWAFLRAGWAVRVYSKGANRSWLHGAQYLHEPIPGIDCGDPTDLNVEFIGDAEGYRNKVYGPEYRGPVSPDTFETSHQAWSIRTAYESLWKILGSGVQEAEFNVLNIADSYDHLNREHDIVVSTLPRDKICINDQHQFLMQQVYAIGDAPALDVKCPVFCPPNTMVYNGDPSYGWYRISNIFGHTTAEWSAHGDRPKPPLRGIATVAKPISTNCDCWPGLQFMGRYGEWKKGVLVHQVYRAVQELIQKLEAGEQVALF